jgi:exodeoxyribonuclease V alpha subunit
MTAPTTGPVAGPVLGRFETDDPHDRRFAHGASGLLRDFNLAGLLEAADVHVARRLGEITGETDEAAGLALSLACRAVRQGSVCVDLARVATLDPSLPWPAPEGWLDRVAASALAAASVVRVDGGLLYLDRYWREEGQVRDDLVARADQPAPVTDAASLEAAAGRVFGAGRDEQRGVAIRATRQWTTVLTGGPGTGKTTTVAGLLAMLTGQSATPLRIALTAPTGKAAARLQESVRREAAALPAADGAPVAGLTAQTLHRLLGWRPDSRTRFRHDRGNRLPHDVVVVDETSMVSLTMMARLLEAVRPDARLVLVGDPDQLASVEAGAVLADLVAGLTARNDGSVAALVTPHRFGERIGSLAQALRDGDADTVLDLLRAGHDEIRLVDPGDPTALAGVREDVVRHALATRAAALAGDATAALEAMDAHRLLCAHREGPYGVATWNRTVERGLADATGAPVGGGWGQEWYVGRPLLVTSNDYGLDLFNGDTGVVVRAGEGVRAVIAGADGHRDFATSRLSDVETMHAMTVHKSQGSQAAEVTVLLPPEDSPLLTRELFYTAVTRAQQVVRVVGTEASIRAGVSRRAQRASGLARRVAPG